MTAEQLSIGYSYVGDIITIVTSIVILFLIAKVLYYTSGVRFNLIMIALHFIQVGALSNIAFYQFVKRVGYVPVVLFVLRDIYHICFMSCIYCFILYIKRMLGVKDRIVRIATYTTRILFVVCAILDILSPLTGVGLNNHNEVWNDSLISPFNFFYVYAMSLICGMLFFYSERIIRSVRLCLLVTQGIIIVIMIVQIFLDTNSFSSFTYLLPILELLILLHSKPYDAKTGALSTSSFDSFLKKSVKRGISVDYLVLKLYLGMAEQIPDELGKVLSTFWHDSFSEALSFELSSDLYVLAVPRIDRNRNSDEKIRKLVATNFPDYYEQYRITYKIIELFNIDFIRGVDDVRGILTYLLHGMEENSIFEMDDKTRETLLFFKSLGVYFAEIESRDDLDEPSVLAYAQPIRNMKTGKFDTAEALIRLSLPEYGIVMPGRFIEIAEAYNHIHGLTRIMLNKVCKEIKLLEKDGYSFERISINVATSEIKEEGFCDELLEIIKRNGINPQKIGIEITESQTEKEFAIISNNMKNLREAGMTLYLDDVGTGYSNLDRVVQYDVDVVKFDRFFLLEAEKNAKIVKMISHLSQAFQDLDYKLLYEGVETDEHENLCLTCGADYIQGFKYSKPVPIEDLRYFFERER